MLGQESQVRLSVFVSLLVVLALLEFIWPRKKRVLTRKQRWPVNVSITAINAIISQQTLAILPIMASLYVTEHNIGLLNLFSMSAIAKAAISYILLDLVVYFQHRIFHEIPILFRLHMVHHTDRDLDVSSGFRFHFLEILLSLIIKTLAIFIIGANPAGVLVFEVILSSGALFNHSNINIRGKLDRILRVILVTPRHAPNSSFYNS